MNDNNRGLFQLSSDVFTKIIEAAEESQTNSLQAVYESPQTSSPFDQFDLFKEMEEHKAFTETLGIANPYFKSVSTTSRGSFYYNDQAMIQFSSYNYLGFCGHPNVNSAVNAVINEYGTSASASRLVSGERDITLQLESELASFYQTERALVFVSGHATYVSTLSTLFGKDDLILYDELAHNSIIVGAKLSGANSRTFRHNDVEHLEQQLTRNRDLYRHVLIVVEGLYGMDGDTPNLESIIRIKYMHNTLLMVDEAHALGVIGRRGRGTFEYCDVNPKDIDIWMGILSKTLASCGGYIAGSQSLIQMLKYKSPGFVYSVGIAPPMAAAAVAALEMLSADEDGVSKLQSNATLFYTLAVNNGLPIGNSAGHAITTIICNSSIIAVKLSNALFDDGIFALPIVFPAVPEKSARVRFFITAQHTKPQIVTAIEQLTYHFKRLMA